LDVPVASPSALDAAAVAAADRRVISPIALTFAASLIPAESSYAWFQARFMMEPAEHSDVLAARVHLSALLGEFLIASTTRAVVRLNALVLSELTTDAYGECADGRHALMAHVRAIDAHLLLHPSAAADAHHRKSHEVAYMYAAATNALVEMLAEVPESIIDESVVVSEG
jgi:hypothetical protein